MVKEKLKVLWVCAFYPFPPDNGSKLKVFFLIKELFKEFDISIFSLIQEKEQLQSDEMEKYCKQIWKVLPENKLETSLDGRRGVLDVIRGAFSPHPKYFYGKPSPNVLRELEAVIAENDFDVIHVASLMMSNYIWDLLGKIKPVTVLNNENIETFVNKEHIPTTGSILYRFRKWFYYWTFRKHEKAAHDKFDYVTLVSDSDRRLLEQLQPGLSKKITILPNGVDCGWYDIPPVEKSLGMLIYNGALTYSANYDAMVYFSREILPFIRAKRPEVYLMITGSTRGVDLSAFTGMDGIRLSGYVNDIRPLVKSAEVCVVPLRIGGGTRLKILEALALGVPVVSTSKGAEGLDLEDGKDLLIADTPQAFAQAVLRVMADEELRAILVENGRNKACTRYDFRKIAEDFKQFHQVISKRVVY